MNVWYCIPSKRPPAEADLVLKLWLERGYKVALFIDHEPFGPKARPAGMADLIFTGVYPGYAAAVNYLIRRVAGFDSDAEWFVTGGDDVEPDLNHTADEIGFTCGRHFGELQGEYRLEGIVDREGYHPSQARMHWSTFGVMQPTGDRWGDGHDAPWEKPGSAYVDRVAGSPWIGREFCRRMYQGNGPLFEGYFHMGEDEELQAVAQKLGVFWQRRELIHLHRHWARPRSDKADMPGFLERANSSAEWRAYKKLFAERAAAGFPGHEPLLYG